MDLIYIKNYVCNLFDEKPDYVVKRLRDLVDKIDKYREKEVEFEDTQILLRRVLSSYEKRYLLLVTEFEVLDSISLTKKIDTVQEILSNLSVLITQLINITSSDFSSSHRNSQFHEIKKPLYEKLENFKSEKITWVSILKTLNLQLEEKVVQSKIQLHKNMEN